MASMVPKLPAEIIHYIIDCFVIQSSGDPKIRTDILHTCSRVSWLFHLHAQKHRFSHIYFPFDRNGRKRAKRLLQALVIARNRHLLPFISSVTFLVRPPVSRAGPFGTRYIEKITQKVQDSIGTVARKLKGEHDWVALLMICLAEMDSLEGMTLASSSWKEVVNWQETTRSIPELNKVLWLAMHPAIRHLTLKNLLHLPITYIMARSEPPPRLRKLTIDNTSFQRVGSEPYLTLLPSLKRVFQDRLATVEELEWVCWGITPFTPWFIWQLPSFTEAYSSLTTIMIHLSPMNWETNRFLQLLLSASRTLQSLELHNVHPFGQQLDGLAPDYLGRFTALRHVGYKAKSADTKRLRCQLELFSKILLSAQTPLPSLSSISVDILEFCAPNRIVNDFSQMMSSSVSYSSFPVAGRWPALESSLCNSNFVNLRRVCFKVKLFVQTKSLRYNIREEYPRSFVSRVYEHPFADIDITIERIGGEDAYKSWVYETDGNCTLERRDVALD